MKALYNTYQLTTKINFYPELIHAYTHLEKLIWAWEVTGAQMNKRYTQFIVLSSLSVRSPATETEFSQCQRQQERD